MNPLATQYLGLQLANPLIAGASPLSRNLDHARRLEDAGIGALVMHSLFEEELIEEEETWLRFRDQAALGHAEADGFLPDHPGYRNALERYVEQLQRLKTALAVPVIASLNGVSRSGWLHHAQALEAAGADALELNVYYLAASPAESGTEVEQRYLDLVAALKSHVRIPFAVKLSPQFSALPHFVRRIEGEGAGGLVLFNRSYQPDIDIDTLSLVHRPTLSHPGDALLALHWIAMLRGRTTISLAAGGGVKSAAELAKLLLVGADAVQVVGALLAHGPERVAEILAGLLGWMSVHEFESISQIRGSLSEARISDPGGYERVHYREVLDGWRSARGVWR